MSRSEDRRVGFDGTAFELCPDCWQALEDWMGAGARVREVGGNAV